MIYKEEFTVSRSNGLKKNVTYYFDVGHKYVFNISSNSIGATERNTWKEHSLPYNKSHFQDYDFEEVKIEDVDSYYVREMIDYIFDRWGER